MIHFFKPIHCFSCQRNNFRVINIFQVNSITCDNFVEDIELLRKQLKLGRIHLLGHSWGAGLAMFYGIKYPDNLNKLILFGCGGASNDYFGEHFENIQKRTSPEDKLALPVFRRGQ